LSVAANNDPGSGIESGGSRGGYWYEQPLEPPAEPEPEQEEINSSQGVKITILEKDLYPLMALWLEKKATRLKTLLL
jgi:hypothetical protein